MDFEEDIESFRPALLELAARWIGSEEAEDAVQDALLSYLTNPAVTSGGVLADLTLSLSTVCNQVRRQQRRMPEVHLGDWTTVPEVLDIGQVELSAVAWERWETARLSRCQRAAMTLHLDGFSTEEIAQRMVVSARTARHHLQAARDVLEAHKVTLAEFRSAEEMFDFCAEVTVYRSPRKVGSGLTDAQRRTE